MSNHAFHPPSELPSQVLSYVNGLTDHAKEFGAVPMNSPKELNEVKAKAHALEPRAKEIHDLEVKLAALKEDYNRDAVPLWHAVSEHLGYAKLHADKQDKQTLKNFLAAFAHHQARAKAAKDAQPSAAPAK